MTDTFAVPPVETRKVHESLKDDVSQEACDRLAYIRTEFPFIPQGELARLFATAMFVLSLVAYRMPAGGSTVVTRESLDRMIHLLVRVYEIATGRPLPLFEDVKAWQALLSGEQKFSQTKP